MAKKLVDPIEGVTQKQTDAPLKKSKMKKGKRSTAGITKKMAAAQLKRNAELYPDGVDEAGLADARCIGREAESFLKPLEPVQMGIGNEALPVKANAKENLTTGYIRDTLQESPNQIHIDASLRRMERASDAHVLEQAIDAAESVGARNSLEKMLAHQMAACHDQAMRLMAKLNGKNTDTIEIQRLTNAAARLLTVYQQAILTLHKLRTGGRQLVTVQHVNVEDGGQAVVTGSMKTGGGQGPKGRGQTQN